MPTLGERSHEEVVEVASHLGELPLAPFPALAHLGVSVLEEWARNHRSSSLDSDHHVRPSQETLKNKRVNKSRGH